MAILTTFEKYPITTMVDDPDKNDSEGALFQMYRQAWLPRMLETPVLVNTTEAGLVLIEYHPNTAKFRVAVTASSIINVIPGRPFHVLVANFAENPTNFLHHMLVAVTRRL